MLPTKDTQKKIAGGFTLLEAIVSIFLLTVGIVGISSLISQTISSSSKESSRLTVAYLAQEGVELVRNIRDNNWLEQRNNPLVNWDDDLPEGDWEADYNSLSLAAYAGRYLKQDNSFYNYTSGSDTKFKRKITIFDKTDLSSPLDGIPDMFKVTVTIEWQEKGKTNNFSVQDYLYNW